MMIDSEISDVNETKENERIHKHISWESILDHPFIKSDGKISFSKYWTVIYGMTLKRSINAAN